MTAYYYNRYRRRTNWGAYHSNKRTQLTNLFAGIDKDIESIFLNLDRTSRESIFSEYGQEYGDSAEKYARNTFAKWKSGKTKLSGQTAERLLNLLPPFLTQAKRYELVKKLRDYYMNKIHTNEHVTTSHELWKQDLVPVVNRVIERSSNFKLPEELKMRATWLAGGDADGAIKILTSVEQEEAKLRTAYLDVEFRRLEQYVNLVQNAQAVSHTIVLPQGKIHVTIQQKKEPFINRIFGGKKMGNDSRELVPREELERALVKQQAKGELLNLSFNDLNEKQKTALRERVLNEKLNLELSQQKANQRFDNSTRDMANTIKAVNALEHASKSDYKVESFFETASGSTNITVKKNNNTVVIVVAIVIGIIIFMFLKR